MGSPPADPPANAARALAAGILGEAALAGLPEGLLTGVYLHGSVVLGGWHPARSDVDLLVVATTSAEPVLAAIRAALEERTWRSTGVGVGVECSVVTRDAAQRPDEPWPFLLHLSTTSGGAPRWVDGRAVAGDPDLLMHYVVTREHGWAAYGPAPEHVFGAVSRRAVLEYLRGELSWALGHGTESYVVLNALRAIIYAREGRVVSKIQAGREVDDPALSGSVILRALRAQEGKELPRSPGPEARSIVDLADAVLSAAVHAAPGT